MDTRENIRLHEDPASLGLDGNILAEAPQLLEAGRDAGQHNGAQVVIARHGTVALEAAIGEAAPGRPLTPDSLLPWFSASKPVIAMAVAMLYEQGKLGLDDPVRRYLPAFGNGKEACTLRHVLTHQGGFAGSVHHDKHLDWQGVLDAVCAHPAEYPPGEKAGYHPTSGWYVLAEVVQQIDGRPIAQFVAEEIFAPLDMTDSHLGLPPERRAALGDRLAMVHQGASEREPFASEAFITRFNDPAAMAVVNPSGGVRGPARELGRLYDCLLGGGAWNGRQLLQPCTVELFTACHRWGLPDMTLAGAPLAWGLGFCKHGNADIHRGYSRRVFNHSGMVSSVALGDPANGLSCVVITTGLLDPLTNARRLREATGCAVRALLD